MMANHSFIRHGLKISLYFMVHIFYVFSMKFLRSDRQIQTETGVGVVLAFVVISDRSVSSVKYMNSSLESAVTYVITARDIRPLRPVILCQLKNGERAGAEAHRINIWVHFTHFFLCHAIYFFFFSNKKVLESKVMTFRTLHWLSLPIAIIIIITQVNSG